jgi:hypothetical protein
MIAVQKSLKMKPRDAGIWEHVGVEKKTPTRPHSASFRQSILGRGRRSLFAKFLTHR